jgi:PAS domain S-box-containing protein
MLELQRSEEHFRAVAETSKEAIITADENGGIHYANRAAAEMFGIPPADLPGRPLTNLIPEGREERHVGRTVELLGRKAGGIEFPVELSLGAWSSRGRRYTTAIIRDITHRRAGEEQRRVLNEELQRILRDLQRSNRELEQFAYIVSHDLKEPLRMIQSFAGILAADYEDRLDGKGREALAYLTDGAQRLQALISDLLMYSRFGELKQIQPVDCAALVEGVRRDLGGVIAEMGAIIDDRGLPTVLGSASALHELFQNLVSNAIKFRGSEPPHIAVSAERTGDDWLFSVRDNGIGIDEQHHERIFLMFQRLHSRKEYPGTGIGLAICKKVVESHGGRIWVESAPGHGAAFRFTLPIAPHPPSRETTA